MYRRDREGEQIRVSQLKKLAPISFTMMNKKYHECTSRMPQDGRFQDFKLVLDLMYGYRLLENVFRVCYRNKGGSRNFSYRFWYHTTPFLNFISNSENHVS